MAIYNTTSREVEEGNRFKNLLPSFLYLHKAFLKDTLKDILNHVLTRIKYDYLYHNFS